jgi:PAS domain S-box-containing protein
MESTLPEPAEIITEISRLKDRVAELEQRENVLSDENRSLRELCSRSTMGYQALDENGCIVEVNQAWLNFLGYSWQEVVGMNFGELLHPDWKNQFQENFSRFKALGEVQSVEFKMRKKDGSFVFVSINGRISKDSQGRFQQTNCILHDITRLKQIEGKLVRSEKKWLNTIVSIPLIAISLDLRGRIVFANSHFLKLVGWSEQEVIGHDWFDMFIPDDIRDEIRQVFSKTMEKKDTLDFSNYENDIVTRTGERRTVAWSNVLSKGTHGDIIDVTCLGVDLSERKRIEEALRHYTFLMKEMGKAAKIGGWEFDPATGKGSWTEEVARIHEVDPGQETSVETGLSFYSDESRARITEAIEEAIATGNPYELELELTTANGTHKWVKTIGHPYFENDKVIKVRGSFQDITALKLADREREILQKQLIQAQKMESVGRLAGGVAHDFNNMLSVILGFSEIAICQTEKNQPIYTDLLEIQQAARHSADLTRQLLAFARKQTVSPKILDLNDTVESMLGMLRRLIGEDIELLWLPGKKLGLIKIDPSQIDQILANLCVNARDAISDTGKVIIRTSDMIVDETLQTRQADVLPGRYILLSVSDTGCGMDRQTQMQLFEPFFTTKEMGKGTGLGLASVYGIVKQNNGFIDFSSEPGEGSIFRIYLPQYGDGEESLRSNDPVTPALRGSETILLVEDEPSILRVVKRMIEALGYKVLAANSAVEAIDLARAHAGELHLLVTDVIMPEMNGRDLANALKPICPALKNLFMSGYTADVIAHHGVLDEGTVFIHKPFTPQDLAVKIREALTETA